MKKIPMIFISIFTLVTVVFAQNYQHKIDSLQNEKVKAEKAKRIADEELREIPNDENYQISKDAREKIEGLDKALQQTLKDQAAEEAAKAAEKELIKRRELQEKEERILAVYNKRFLEFEYAGVDEKVKNYIKSELAKDPNWDIKDMKVLNHLRRNHYRTITVSIVSTSGSEDIELVSDKVGVSNADVEKIKNTIAQALDWHQNPDKFYLFKKEKEENELVAKKMTEAISNYYLGFTGTKYVFTDKIGGCSEVEMYMYTIPDDKRYYHGKDCSYYLPRGGLKKEFCFTRAEHGDHYFLICDDKNIGYTNGSVYTALYKFFMPDEDPFYLEESQMRKAELPSRLIKTFERKDYMQ